MSNFIEDFWIKNASKWDDKLVTRFPPEPNGFLHIGHAKSSVLNFMLAEKYGGKCNLRMDDTNPEKESEHYVAGIVEMLKWLGVAWSGDIKYASDYFDSMHKAAKFLIKSGLAYMDFTDREEMRKMRGTLTTPGVRSEDVKRDNSWHLAEFDRMTAGKYEEGHCCLRAKIDMASPNINLRDPVLYRIKKVAHDRTGSKWLVYPTYDFAHPFSDGMEGISLSLCTLEFEDHRPLYNWVVEKCEWFFPEVHAPVELEFARLELDKGLTSKRKINAMVEAGAVDGWDDPRLVTLAGLRRRGFTPSALRTFCVEAGVSKANSVVPFSRVEDFLRLDLDEVAPRRIVVANPVALDIEGLPETRLGTAANHPNHPEMGTRPFELSAEMWLERDDVRAAGCAEPGFKRVEPGKVFRIMPGLVLECTEVVVAEGRITSVKAKVSEAKPRCTVHGLSRVSAVPVEIWEPETIYGEDANPSDFLIVKHGYVEPLAVGVAGTWHAVRYGYCTWDRNHMERLILTTKLRSGM